MLAIKRFFIITALLLFGTTSLLPATVLASAKDDIQCGVNAASNLDGCNAPTKEDSTSSINNIISKILNVFSVIVGVAAVIMIVLGGFRYITSSGDSAKVKAAKDTIIYAIIGLVVVALAQVLVKFVLSKSTT